MSEGRLPRRVRIVEVGARDGLQNETRFVPTAAKIELIARLVAAGLEHIEATAFVSPRWVPQLADHAEVMRGLTPHPTVRFSALVPNQQGFDAAVAAGAREVAVFAAASETFSRRNTNCSVDESLERFRRFMPQARAQGVAVRGYISCAIACPYEGGIAPAAVAALAQRLAELGCYEISLGDTIGVGTPGRVRDMIEAVALQVPPERLAGHFHDTYGQALVNVYAAMQCGLRVFDSSVAGLGGCPYAVGASGNLATEDLVYLLDGLGIQNGVDLPKLCDAGRYITAQLGIASRSRVATAMERRPAESP